MSRLGDGDGGCFRDIDPGQAGGRDQAFEFGSVSDPYNRGPAPCMSIMHCSESGVPYASDVDEGHIIASHPSAVGTNRDKMPCEKFRDLKRIEHDAVREVSRKGSPFTRLGTAIETAVLRCSYLRLQGNSTSTNNRVAIQPASVYAS